METITIDRTTAPKWNARLATKRIYPKILVKTKDGGTKVDSWPLDLFAVVIERAGEQIVFPVTWPLPHRRPVFTDYRDCSTGMAGSTGLWGTRPVAKPGGKRRSLTPTGWKAEVRRFIGEAEAEKIVRFVKQGKPPL
jgi:hypothetical protein